jgi:hypothetical protein
MDWTHWTPAEMTDSELAQELASASGDRLAELVRELEERRAIRASIRPYIPQQRRPPHPATDLYDCP